MSAFDPEFSDCDWTDVWLHVPLIQLMPGVYQGFVVKSWQITMAEVCGMQIEFSVPLDVRGLVTDDGTLWMSDVPQERVMMFRNAARSHGNILVGGLGIGLYPQYALPVARSIRVIEREASLIEVVEPLVQVVAQHYRVPLQIRHADINETLDAAPEALYDTIFLDTWPALDPLWLPVINHLRDKAFRHLASNGKILLWGYSQMLKLFEEACAQLLSTPPAERPALLSAMTQGRPEAENLLMPVLEKFEGQYSGDWQAALRWCRDYAIHVTVEGKDA